MRELNKAPASKKKYRLGPGADDDCETMCPKSGCMRKKGGNAECKMTCHRHFSGGCPWTYCGFSHEKRDKKDKKK